LELNRGGGDERPTFLLGGKLNRGQSGKLSSKELTSIADGKEREGPKGRGRGKVKIDINSQQGGKKKIQKGTEPLRHHLDEESLPQRQGGKRKRTPRGGGRRNQA